MFICRKPQLKMSDLSFQILVCLSSAFQSDIKSAPFFSSLLSRTCSEKVPQNVNEDIIHPGGKRHCVNLCGLCFHRTSKFWKMHWNWTDDVWRWVDPSASHHLCWDSSTCPSFSPWTLLPQTLLSHQSPAEFPPPSCLSSAPAAIVSVNPAQISWRCSYCSP